MSPSIVRLDIREVRTCPSCRHFYIAAAPEEYPGNEWFCMLYISDEDYTPITDNRVWEGEFPEWCPLPVKHEP